LAINSLLASVSVSGYHLSLEPFRFHVNCFHFLAAVFVRVRDRDRYNCVREMLFRFTCVVSECSAVEVACFAQNIRHSSARLQVWDCI